MCYKFQEFVCFHYKGTYSDETGYAGSLTCNGLVSARDQVNTWHQGSSHVTDLHA